MAAVLVLLFVYVRVLGGEDGRASPPLPTARE
jgi:hypothetical protein